VEHVLATQCPGARRIEDYAILVHGKRPKGVTSEGHHPRHHRKNRIGGVHRSRCGICRTGDSELSMDGRMTVCNMTIEGGAASGHDAPDETTFHLPRGTTVCARGKNFKRR